MHQLQKVLFTVVNASTNDSYRKEKKNMTMQTTITSRKETATAKQSPEENNEVPIVKILQSKCRQIKCLNDEKKCLILQNTEPSNDRGLSG